MLDASRDRPIVRFAHDHAWYIGSQGLESTYGAAASIVLLLIRVYYSAQIILFGAQATGFPFSSRPAEIRSKKVGRYISCWMSSSRVRTTFTGPSTCIAI